MNQPACHNPAFDEKEEYTEKPEGCCGVIGCRNVQEDESGICAYHWKEIEQKDTEFMRLGIVTNNI